MLFKQKQLSLVIKATLFSISFISGSANADHLLLDDVEVTAKRKSIETKSSSKLAGDAAAVLVEQPGISLYRAGGVSSLPVLRGLADDRIRVQVDGMDLISSCANHMNPPLSYLAPENITSIDIYAGVSPVSLGGDSIAGTIKVESEKPEFAHAEEGLLLSGELGTFYKSNNNARGINIKASAANEHAYMKYTGATVEANNYHAGSGFKPAGQAANQRRFLDADEVGSSYYRTINHTFDFGVKQDNHQLSFKVGLQKIPEQGFVNQRMDMTDNQAQHYNLTYQGAFDWGDLDFQLYHESVEHGMNFGEDKQLFYGTAPGMPMDTLGKTTGVKLKGKFNINQHDSLTVGGEYQRYRLDDYWAASGNGMMMSPNTFININNGQRDSFDLFAEYEKQWKPSVKTVIGLRHSTVKMNADTVQGYNNNVSGMAGYATAANAFNQADRSDTDHNLDFSAQAEYQPDPTQAYTAGFAIKNRSPNLYERYTWANTNSMVMNMINLYGDGNGYVGNLSLKQETAYTLSTSAHWQDAKHESWSIKATPYFSYVKDFIDAVSCSSVGKTCMARTDGFTNLSLDNESARLYGIDINAKKQFQSGPWGKWAGTAVVSYVRGKNTKKNDDLYNIMPLNARFSLKQSLGGWHNQLEVVMVSAKSKVQALRNENKTAGYSLLNLYTSYDWQHARLDLGIENIFDKHYYDPLGGVYLGQGATMGTMISNGVRVPGMGRSINIGLTLFY